MISQDAKQIYFSGNVENVLFSRGKSFYEQSSNISLGKEKALLSLSLERHCPFLPQLLMVGPPIEKVGRAQFEGSSWSLHLVAQVQIKGAFFS